MLVIFISFRGAWSFHAPDSIVLRVMNLLTRKELLISEKESLPVLTCGPSQKSASSEPYAFAFFNDKLNFSQLVRLQFNLLFCYSPHRSVTYSHVTKPSDFSGLAFRWPYDSMKCLQYVFTHFLDVDHRCHAI
ncbi:uncharacterized protein TNCV_153641 [Trichonephila clavipes]|nr:uncharacterized protein TNCV_153641 [Trichonephila clavipes]